MKEIMYNPFPENIRKIGVAAPASRVDRTRIRKSVLTAEKWKIEVKIGKHLFGPSEEKYFSADHQDRLADLNEMISDESIDLLLCGRGGYGSAALLPFLDWKALAGRKNPLIVGGFSDITALHLAMLAKGAGRAVACPMFARLHQTVLHRDEALSMRRALRLASSPNAGEWMRICKVRAFGEEKRLSGELIPANLTLLTRLCGTPYLPDLTGKILLLEEVGELPRKIDFSFVQLILAGILQRCSGVILGQYTSCGTARELFRIFRRAAGASGVPFYGFLPFGHGERTCSLVCGEFCIVDRGYLFLRSGKMKDNCKE